MQIIEPWRTRIGVVNLKDHCDLMQLADEVLALSYMVASDDDKPYTPTDQEFRLIVDVRQRLITPAVIDFIHQEFNYKYQTVQVESFGRWLPEGKALGAHLHGSSAVTTILYLGDYDSEIVLYDPRGNACRGYPREIRDSYFGQHHYSPKAGDLVILPSYLEHYVPPVKDQMRLTLVSDYYFNCL